MKKLILIFAFMSIFNLSANAEENKYPDLQSFITTEVDQQVWSFNQSVEEEKGLFDDFYLNLIRLRIRGVVGLDVPFLASFEIKPFIELRWKRKLPEGMTGYKP